MSSSLLKRSLDLFKEDLVEDGTGTRKKKKSQNPAKLLGTNKKGLKRQRRKIKKQLEADRKSQMKSLPEVQHRDARTSSRLTDNLSMISKLGQLETVQKTTVNKILEHQKGRLSRDRAQEEKVPKVDASILFNNRDFDEGKEETDWDI